MSFVSVDNRSITGHQTDEAKGELFEGINAVAYRIREMVTPFFSGLLGGKMTGGLLFTKILFFLIVFGLIKLSLSKVSLFREKTAILNVIAIAVSLLAVRGLSIEMIETILLPSKALGVALLAGVPFVIYFIVVNVGFKDQPSILRRVAWIFFAVVFIGLWASRISDFGDSNLHYIYLVTSIIAIIMAWIDGTIKGFFEKVEIDRIKNLNKIEYIGEMKARIRRIEQNEEYSESQKNQLIKRLEEQIKNRERRK